MRNYFFILLIVPLSVTVSAQTSSKKKKGKNKVESRQSVQQPSSLNPASTKVYAPRRVKSTGKITYNAVDKFYKRMEAVAKREAKAEKLSKKPQYSDPMYFGHKRPPKKHPPGKMKYCKVCGISH